jgi:uncharacterized membrane protein
MFITRGSPEESDLTERINTVAYFIHEKIWARHQKGASASRADLHQPTV